MITNVKLYFDRFESELAPSVDEPTTPEYDERAAGEEEVESEEEFTLADWTEDGEINVADAVQMVHYILNQ